MMKWLTGFSWKCWTRGGAESTSCYIVKMLCQADVNGVLGFTYMTFVIEGACDYVDNIGVDVGEA